jgi:hypothetical protein
MFNNGGANSVMKHSEIEALIHLTAPPPSNRNRSVKVFLLLFKAPQQTAKFQGPRGHCQPHSRATAFHHEFTAENLWLGRPPLVAGQARSLAGRDFSKCGLHCLRTTNAIRQNTHTHKANIRHLASARKQTRDI